MSAGKNVPSALCILSSGSCISVCAQIHTTAQHTSKTPHQCSLLRAQNHKQDMLQGLPHIEVVHSLPPTPLNVNISKLHEFSAPFSAWEKVVVESCVVLKTERRAFGVSMFWTSCPHVKGLSSCELQQVSPPRLIKVTLTEQGWLELQVEEMPHHE